VSAEGKEPRAHQGIGCAAAANGCKVARHREVPRQACSAKQKSPKDSTRRSHRDDISGSAFVPPKQEYLLEAGRQCAPILWHQSMNGYANGEQHSHNRLSVVRRSPVRPFAVGSGCAAFACSQVRLRLIPTTPHGCGVKVQASERRTTGRVRRSDSARYRQRKMLAFGRKGR
jgi:hypothetical protein